MNPVLDVININKTYDGFRITDLSLSLEENTIMGLIGPNGAGKTTTLKAIMNMTKLKSGQINIFGNDHIKYEKSNKERIGYVFDESPYFEHLNPLQNSKLMAPFYPSWDQGLFLSYLDEFQINPKKKLSKLSKGMKMKFNILMALSHRPKLLIMDEPTAGLDPVFRRELLTHLHDLIDDFGCSILFSSHITSDLDKIADYATFIHNGKTILSMDTLQLKEEYQLVKGKLSLLDTIPSEFLIGVQRKSVGFEALTNKVDYLSTYASHDLIIEPCTIEDIVYHTTKENS